MVFLDHPAPYQVERPFYGAQISGQGREQSDLGIVEVVNQKRIDVRVTGCATSSKLENDGVVVVGIAKIERVDL